MPPIASSLAEYGDRIYMVGPVQLVDQPTSAEFETFAFRNEVSASPGLETLREHAPNPHLLWLRGQYVEADNPNANGDAWTAGDLAIASLTPIFQPISVLHDFSSSVGFIADARMLTPSEHGVPRPRIDTILAVWAHRYPQVAEEIKNNAAQGMLAQSMECVPIDTEILTRRGWRRYDELREGDETVGYNAETEKNEWTPIKRVIRKRAEVTRYFHKRWRGAECTAGHRWLIEEPSHDYKGKHTLAWDQSPTLKTIADAKGPSRLVLTAEADLDDDDRLPTTPDEAAVIGWVAGDGTINRTSKYRFAATITQNKPDGIMALELALDAAGVEYGLKVDEAAAGREATFADGRVAVTRRAMNRYSIGADALTPIWTRAELDHLSWTSFVLKLSSAARKAWLQALYDAEGNANHGSEVIAQQPGPLKDAIALAAYLCGHRPASHHHGGDNSQAASHIRLCRQPVQTDSLRELHLGEQEVWCPETGLGSWTMRQHDQVMLTGNCLSGSYECSECGMVFHRQPHFAEKDTWCEHLKGSTGERSHRLLKNVTFSGVGLIFGTRGARPAFKDAQLEVAELAAMHEGVHAASVDDRRKLNDKQTPSTGSIVTQIQVDQQEYEATVAKAAKVDGLSTKVTELTARTEELTTKVSELEPVAAKVPDLEKQVEKIPELETKVESAEADKIKAEEEAQQEKARADAAEEEKNKAALRDERIESLGEGFKSRLEKAPTTKAKLHDQAESLSDEEWKARLDELKETLGVDPQAAASAEDLTKAGLFTNEQVAQAGLVTPDAASSTTTASDSSRRRSAIGGLARSFGKQPQKTT